jgi:diguanylate cyclase (GGDEF)-like protein
LRSRDYFMGLLEQEILRAGRSGRAFALLMLDLDGLKAANDRFGHASGDQLLHAVAETLSRDIRVTDLAARYGGDEFVILLPETDLAGAMLVADKVRIDVSRLALPHDGQVVRTSCSIGVVTFPDDGRTSTELMRRADLAMYEAKRRGRDQIVRFAREATGIPMAGSPAINVAGAKPQTQMEPGAPLETQPSPTAGVIAVGTYPDAAEPSAGVPMSAEERPIGATKPEFAPLPQPASSPETPIEVPPESPGKAPWESSAG